MDPNEYFSVQWYWFSFVEQLAPPGMILALRVELVPDCSAGPKRGSLNVWAWKRQEIATFLPRSFVYVAVQFFGRCSAAFGRNDFRTAEKWMSQCNFCSATFRRLQHNFCFRLWNVAGVGFGEVGFKTYGIVVARAAMRYPRNASPLKCSFSLSSPPPGSKGWRAICHR